MYFNWWGNLKQRDQFEEQHGYNVLNGTLYVLRFPIRLGREHHKRAVRRNEESDEEGQHCDRYFGYLEEVDAKKQTHKPAPFRATYTVTRRWN